MVCKELRYTNKRLEEYPIKYLNGRDMTSPFTGIKRFDLDPFKDLAGDSRRNKK